MKLCPECKREYADDTLNYCLDDGCVLVLQDEPATAILSGAAASELPTRILGRSSASKALGRNFWIVGAAVIAVLFASLLGYRYFARPEAGQISSIAVMPFVNEGGDPEMEYLSDGMTESLLNSLSQLPGLSVKARSSVFRYKGKDTDAKSIGRELDVEALLNGRIVQRGQDLAVYLELVDTGTGNRIWGGQYVRKQADLISLQTELAHDVSQKIRTKLSGADEQMLAKRYTDNTEAYQLYLRGRYHANKFTVQDWQKAVDYYKQSIDRDPAFPLPYVGMAEYYQMNSNGTLAPIVAQPNAEAYALRALAIDDQLAEAHSALGAVRFYRDWDWAAAQKEFIRAIELSPNSAEAHYWYSYPATVSGHYDIGIREMQRALELDPLNETINADLGWAYYCAGKTDEALVSYKRALELQPDFPMVWSYLGLAYERQGRYAEAVAELDRARERENVPTTLGYLGYVLARSGNSARARQVIEELKKQSKSKFVSPYYIAMIYAALGDNDQAFAYLEKAYEVRADSMAELRHDPLLETLRGDPRFSQLLAKVGGEN